MDKLIFDINQQHLNLKSDETIQTYMDALLDWVYDVTYTSKLADLAFDYTYQLEGIYYRGDTYNKHLLQQCHSLPSSNLYSFTPDKQIALDFMENFESGLEEDEEIVVPVLFEIHNPIAFPITDLVVESFLYTDYLREQECKVTREMIVDSIKVIPSPNEFNKNRVYYHDVLHHSKLDKSKVNMKNYKTPVQHHLYNIEHQLSKQDIQNCKCDIYDSDKLCNICGNKTVDIGYNDNTVHVCTNLNCINSAGNIGDKTNIKGF